MQNEKEVYKNLIYATLCRKVQGEKMRNKYLLIRVFIILLFLCELTQAQKIGGWVTTDSLHDGRKSHAGVQLNNGNILITGGYTPTQGNGSNEAELFDINIQKWSMITPMNKRRAYHDLVKLKDGSILAIGGFSERSCEILSNDYSKWIFTDSLKTRKYWGASAVLLQDGNVLVIGGTIDTQTDTTGALKECELYNYNEKKWQVMQQLHVGRYSHTATLLNDGKVLVVGGKNIDHGVKLLNSCEIYDPVTRGWKYTSPMNYSRAGHSATLLSNGKVLVIGGQQSNSELYDPITSRWEVVGRVYLASGHNRAMTLKNEEYLLLVHDVDGYVMNPGWELYSLEKFESIYNERFKRYIKDRVIIKINENRVLVAGGEEAILGGGDLFIVPTFFCQIYDINLTSIREDNGYHNLPNDFFLSCYPNPFNGSTNITVELDNTERISLIVYNVLGQEIGIIHKGEINAGKHMFRYSMNGRSSGVYFVRMSSSKKEKLIKIIYQK